MIFILVTLAGMVVATVALDRRRRLEERQPIRVRADDRRDGRR